MSSLFAPCPTLKNNNARQPFGSGRGCPTCMLLPSSTGANRVVNLAPRPRLALGVQPSEGEVNRLARVRRLEIRAIGRAGFNGEESHRLGIDRRGSADLDLLSDVTASAKKRRRMQRVLGSAQVSTGTVMPSAAFCASVMAGLLCKRCARRRTITSPSVACVFVHGRGFHGRVGVGQSRPTSSPRRWSNFGARCCPPAPGRGR